MVKHKFITGDRVAVVLDKSNTNVRPGIYIPLSGHCRLWAMGPSTG
jgi:hypothetical protein